MMQKIMIWLVVVMVVWLQTTIVLHGVEHGSASHEHHGKICELCVFAKHVEGALPSISVLPSIIVQSYHYSSISEILLSVAWLQRANPPRAPPVIG